MTKYVALYEGDEKEYVPNRNKVVKPMGKVCHVYLPKCFEGRLIERVVFKE